MPSDSQSAATASADDMVVAPLSREAVIGRLRAAGIAPTHQRIEIAQVLFDCHDHLSAEQLLVRVNARFAQSSKATIYNTLKLLVEHGMVRELFVERDKVVYDPNMTPHHHFYDVDSGKLTDIPAEGVEIRGLPPLPQGVLSAGVDVIVRIRSAA
jgi:Fur family transcriptional regulator, iron response regulator